VAGKFNPAVSGAISARFKPEGAGIVPALFTPEFVSDVLFAKAFDDPSPILKKLELANSTDFLLLARQQVQYSQDPSLENVMTANLRLEVMMLPVAAPDQPEAWTLSATGAGFTQKDARSLAEERLIKQIAKDPKMSLNPPVTNN